MSEEKVLQPRVSSTEIPSEGATNNTESGKSAFEEALAAIKSDDNPTGGNMYVGEPETDPMFRAVANYFDIESKDYKAVGKDIGFILEYLSQELGKDMFGAENLDKSLTFLRSLEERLSPLKDFTAKRYKRLYNYLVLKQKRGCY